MNPLIILIRFLYLFLIIIKRRLQRPWFHFTGIGLWTSDEKRDSQYLFDPWSITHIAHGTVFYIVLVSILNLSGLSILWIWKIVIILCVEMIWEIFENTPYVIQWWRTSGQCPFYRGDSIINSLGDIFACFCGICIATLLTNLIF